MKHKNNIALFLFFLLISCKSATLNDARIQFLRGEFYAASETYRDVYRNLDPKNRAMRGVVAFEMAESFRKLNMPIRASNAYTNAIRYNYPDSLMHLRFAQMLHREGKYQEAKEAYQTFLNFDSTNYLALSGLQGTILADLLIENPTRFRVHKMDIFNSNRGEFSPMLTKNDNELYFTSSRNDARGDSISAITGMKNNDFFVSVKNESGEWQRPKVVDSEINTNFDEGTASFTSDGRWLFYTFSPQYHDRASTPKIYLSGRGSESWNTGQELTIVENDSVSIFAHPSISPSGEWLYFVSDMPGGYGGKDIWRAAMNETKVLYIENLGPEINTPGDELFPYVYNDSLFYFSSDGHPGIGGLDIFEAKLHPSGIKWAIKNMGSPINSSMDDFGMTFEQNGKNGFFSSNRGDARGRDHIYRFEYPEIKVQVEGFVVDEEENFLANAEVHVIGDNGSQQKIITKKDGTYRFVPQAGISYLLMAKADGFLNQRKTLSISSEEKDSIYYADFQLLPYNKPVVIENIFYDFNKATLREESKDALKSLIEMLKEHSDIEIELSAHTDRKGSDSYNLQLSQRRAQSVVDYLVEHGIYKDRLKARGYGKQQPKKISNALAKKYDFLTEDEILTEEFIEKLNVEDQETADQINRRTEFKIIDPTFGLK